MKLGNFERVARKNPQVVEENLAAINAQIELYLVLFAQMEAALDQKKLGYFEYEKQRTYDDELYQGLLEMRKRLLTQRDRASSRLAKAVLKQKT